MAVKPILVIYLSSHISQYDTDVAMKGLEEMKLTQDYYVLAVPSNGEETKVEVFYEKDFNEVKYNQLKKIIADKMAKRHNRLKSVPTVHYCVIEGCNNIAVGEEKTFCNEHESFWDKAEDTITVER